MAWSISGPGRHWYTPSSAGRKPPEVARMRMDSDSENVWDHLANELYPFTPAGEPDMLWSGRRAEQRHALHVVGHGEQVEGPEPLEGISVPGEAGHVPRQRGRVAGDVGDRPRPPGGDRVDERTPGPRAGRAEDDEVDRVRRQPGEHRADVPGEYRRARHVGLGVRTGPAVALDEGDEGRLADRVGQEPGEQPHTGVEI